MIESRRGRPRGGAIDAYELNASVKLLDTSRAGIDAGIARTLRFGRKPHLAERERRRDAGRILTRGHRASLNPDGRRANHFLRVPSLLCPL